MAPANQHFKRQRMFLYLIPIVGVFPALWTLYRRRENSDAAELATSRLAVTLAGLWLSGYILLETSAGTSETLHLPFLIASTVLTSTYFLVNLGLMVRLWKKIPLWLPGVSKISDRLP
jgi:hypothetical protein